MGDSYLPDRYYDSDYPYEDAKAYDQARRPPPSTREPDDFRIRGAASEGRYRDYRDKPPRQYRDDFNDRQRKYRRRSRTPPRQAPSGGLTHPLIYEDYDVPTVPHPDGSNDVSRDDQPLRFVLVRNLPSSVSEAVFAKGLEKLDAGDGEKASGATRKSLHRVLLIRDRATGRSLGYGFAEYHEVKDAKAAVAKAMAMKQCTIGSSELTVCFPHNGIFPPSSFGKPEYDAKYMIKMTGGQQHKYHDERYYAAEHVVNEQPPRRSASPPKRKHDTDQQAAMNKKRGIETLENKSKKPKQSGTAAPAFLQHWQNKAAELRGDQSNATKDAPVTAATGVNAISAAPSEATEVSTTAVSSQQTFAHEGEKTACYLCSSQFKAKEGLMRHLQESELHAKNLADEAAVAKGYERLTAKGIDSDSTVKLPSAPAVKPAEQSDASLQYRDRAKERRQEEVSSGVKVGFSLKAGSNKRSQQSAPVSGSSSDNESAKPSYGKGMNMLQKAGWSEGQSLGTGTGLTAPIDQSLYASGVGLGHEGSKMGDAVEEAARITRDDRGGFLEKTREKARKRYEQMG